MMSTDEDKNIQKLKIFETWAIKHGYYNKFIGAMYKQSNMTLEIYINTRGMSGIISGCIHWSLTPQGFNYWYEVSQEWAQYYKQIEKDLK